MLRYLTVVGMLAGVGCTTVMKYTPQEMSEGAINHVKVDPATDPNPQTLAADQVACANKARLQYPIGVDEAAIMTGSAVGGAASGAAGSAGSGNAGRATAVGSIGGLSNGIDKVRLTYITQIYQQAIHYGLCLVEQGHVISGLTEQDLTCARTALGCPTML